VHGLGLEGTPMQPDISLQWPRHVGP
jgi:hypothetical protein